MDSDISKPIQAASTEDKAPDASFLADAGSLWSELRGLGHDHLQLAVLETRRAGESLVAMLVAGVMLAVLLIGVWLGILAAIVLALIGQGVTASSAILLAIAVNLLPILFLVGVLRRKSRFLQWPALIRSLHPNPAKQGNPNKVSA